jgi:hypothetical protein
MPSVLFAGGRLDSLTVINGAPSEITTAGTFDATYCDASVQCAGIADVIQATFVDASNNPVNLTSGQTGYVHWEVTQNQTGGSYGTAGQNLAWLVDSSGQPWIAVQLVAGASSYGLFYNSGTGGSPVWTQIGSSFSYVNDTRYTYDLKITIGSPHTVELSRNGSAIASGTFTQAGLTTLRGWRGSGLFGIILNNCRFSQILATEGRSSINAKVKYIRATGAGGNTGWTGAAGNVNEAVGSDATIDVALTAGLRQTYVMSDVTVPSGYVIGTVMHFLRAKHDGASPVNIKSVVRISSTDYDYASNMPSVGTSYSPCLARYDTDPATGVVWTQAGFNAAELGYLSVA